MHPGIHLLGFRISAYYALIALGLILGMSVVRREVVHARLSTRIAFTMCVAVAPGLIVASRLMLVLDDPLRYLADPLLLASPKAGWTSYGALLGTLGAVLAVGRWYAVDVWRYADGFARGILFGHAFGRLGCLAAGCCHGRPADWPLGVEVPWAVRYYTPRFGRTGLLGVPIHPAPLYESLWVLGLFVLASRLRDRQPYPGFSLVVLLGGYGVGRYLIEFTRGDLGRGALLGGWLSAGQGVCVALVGLAVAVHLRRRASCTPS